MFAFELAYQTRVHLSLANVFFLHKDTHLTLLGFCAAAWMVLGWRRSENLQAVSWRRLAADTFQECITGIVLVILFQYVLRVDPRSAGVSFHSFLPMIFSCSFSSAGSFPSF